MMREATRDLLFARVTCRCANSNLTRGLEKSARLELRLRPLDVRIVSIKRRRLTSGEKTEVMCQSRGARPPATLTWFLNQEPLIHAVSQSFSQDGNLTTSILTLDPRPSSPASPLDSSSRVSRLECRAESALTGQRFPACDDGSDCDDDRDAPSSRDAAKAGKSSSGEGTPASRDKSSSSSPPREAKHHRHLSDKWEFEVQCKLPFLRLL